MTLGNTMYEELDEEKDAGICRTCKGKGRFMTRETIDGEVTEQWSFCEDCDGTGYIQEDDWID